MPVDLLTEPRWTAEDLGLPMPDSKHAVSACLPRWQDNIAYEEGDAATILSLQAAYPRFCLHPSVRRLCERVFNTADETGLVFASRTCAERAARYAVWRGARGATIVPVPNSTACGVRVDPADYAKLREYWQHAGENVSSRVADRILQNELVTCSETQPRRVLRQRVADCHGVDSDAVSLHLSGMAAMAATYRAVRRIFPTDTCVQFGFPYVDTLKILERFQPGVHSFFPDGTAADRERLKTMAGSEPIAAVFCETPTNPLLRCPDLPALRKLADQYGFLLIVDDTLAACLNLNVLPYADAVVTSLTKYFSGYGDVIAGSVVINPDGQHAAQLRTMLADEFEELLSDCDVEVLERNSRDMRERITTINDHAAELATRLQQHPMVESVFFPSLGPDPNYQQLRRDDGGYGGLLSFVLKQPEQNTPAVFDHLQVCKGPNLGTHFTLCCPFTILAHYRELDEVEQQGVSRWLLRVSVGVEPLDHLWQRFESALQHATVT